MPTAAPNLHTHHTFAGDNIIRDATFSTRLDLRNALFALAQALHHTQHAPIQIKADIQLNVGGATPSRSTYTITVNDDTFNAAEFDRAVPPRAGNTPTAASPAGASVANAIDVSENGGAEPTPASVLHKPQASEDSLELRPFKRPRTSGPPFPSPGSATTQPPEAENASPAPLPASAEAALQAYMSTWHGEWTQQGGWLFDNITKLAAANSANRVEIEKKLDSVQDTLGQAMNAAAASSTLQLDKVAQLIPWLEHCRKTSADTREAREEKWRTSSASFHDQTRREREAAELRLETMLAEQRDLLRKIARASGVVESIEGDGEGGDGEREGSLGAQLRRELDTEVTRSGGARTGGRGGGNVT